MPFLDTQWRAEPGGSRRFHCPHCHEETEAALSHVRNYVRLLGRAVAPLGRTRDYLTCAVCGRSYDADVAELPSAEAERTFSEDERALQAIAAATVFSDSAVRRVEKAVAAEVIERFTGRDLDEIGMASLLRTARKRWGDPIERLERLGTFTTDRTRRRIVQAAYLVSGADRELHVEEGRLIMRVGEALRMSPREVRDAMQAARASENLP